MIIMLMDPKEDLVGVSLDEISREGYDEVVDYMKE